MDFFKMITTPAIFVSFILILIVLVIVCHIVHLLNKRLYTMEIDILTLKENVDNLISGSKRVERIADAINQRTRSYISNCNEKQKKQTVKKNYNSKNKKQNKNAKSSSKKVINND